MGERYILGLTEDLIVLDRKGKEEQVAVRIDTGATSSSIDMNLAARLKLGPVITSKIIKSASGVRTRPVVRVKIKINGLILEEDFNLADRSHMTYQVLIGQNILKKGNFLIDPNKKNRLAGNLKFDKISTINLN